jgi:hypothetical protein
MREILLVTAATAAATAATAATAAIPQQTFYSVRRMSISIDGRILQCTSVTILIMNQCSICQQSFSIRDVMLRHQRYVHGSDDTVKSDSLSQQITHVDTSEKMNFQQPFSMVVSGPSGSEKTEWT